MVNCQTMQLTPEGYMLFHSRHGHLLAAGYMSIIFEQIVIKFQSVHDCLWIV